MAIFHLTTKVLSRSDGRSAIAAAAYRAGERIHDERTGIAHDYRRRDGVERTEIILPSTAPGWAARRSSLWNQAEAIEKRRDARVAREIEVALPHELPPELRIALVRQFVQREFVDRGLGADIAWHAPSAGGDERNAHAHILLTTRPLNADGFQAKARWLDKKEMLEGWRTSWAASVNGSLAQAGIAATIDHRSLAVQRAELLSMGKLEAAAALDREPGMKLGPVATADARGQPRARNRNDRRRQARRIIAVNRLRHRLRQHLRRLKLEIARTAQSLLQDLAGIRSLALERDLSGLSEPRRAARQRQL